MAGFLFCELYYSYFPKCCFQLWCILGSGLNMLSIGVAVVCIEQYEIENFDENSKVYVPSDSLTVSTYNFKFCCIDTPSRNWKQCCVLRVNDAHCLNSNYFRYVYNSNSAANMWGHMKTTTSCRNCQVVTENDQPFNVISIPMVSFFLTVVK